MPGPNSELPEELQERADELSEKFPEVTQALGEAARNERLEAEIGRAVLDLLTDEGFFDRPTGKTRQYVWTCPSCRCGTWEGHADGCEVSQRLAATPTEPEDAEDERREVE